MAQKKRKKKFCFPGNNENNFFLFTQKQQILEHTNSNNVKLQFLKCCQAKEEKKKILEKNFNLNIHTHTHTHIHNILLPSTATYFCFCFSYILRNKQHLFNRKFKKFQQETFWKKRRKPLVLYREINRGFCK